MRNSVDDNDNDNMLADINRNLVTKFIKYFCKYSRKIGFPLIRFLFLTSGQFRSIQVISGFLTSGFQVSGQFQVRSEFIKSGSGQNQVQVIQVRFRLT